MTVKQRTAEVKLQDSSADVRAPAVKQQMTALANGLKTTRMVMQNTCKTILVLFFGLACCAKQTLAQETGKAQEEAMRKLEIRMNELRSQMADIQSQLEAIRGGKLPATGSIESKPAKPQLQLSEEQKLEAAGDATSDHQTFAQDEADAPRLFNAPLETDYP